MAGNYSDSYDFSVGAGGPQRFARQDSYGLLNVTGQFLSPSEKLSVSWYVNNLTGTKYFDQVQVNGGVGGVYGVAALPITYGAAVTVRF